MRFAGRDGRLLRHAGRRGPAVNPWVAGARPRTLPAAVVPVAVGTACAAGEGDVVAWRVLAAAVIRQWKIHRALYRQYGGRIVYQQGGPEPLDALRRFLEGHEARGDFHIEDPTLRAAFWRYYRDDTIHSFDPRGSREEALAFTAPPWQR